MLVGMTLVCFIGMVLCMFGLTNADGFSHGSLLGPSFSFGIEWNISVTKSQKVTEGIPSMRKPASRNDFSCCRTVWNWSLFLAHPTSWHKRMTSENTQDPSWCWFWVFKVFCKIRVLKQPKSALLCCVSHTTILSVFTCVMNIRHQSIQAFVTRFRPFCQSTCKLVHKPLNIGSTNTSQVKTFHNNLWAYCRQLSYWLLLFIFTLMVIHAWRCDFV